jgi:selenocysteine-specific elongation factor
MKKVHMLNIIVGTAGHIDHGKTALVRALTGIDTDRLEEEKRRGISIELGFAHLDLGKGMQAGFVDVPGHERFIRNMLAGVGGIDLVLLVIAADESIKPQTREHFDICRLLGIPSGIVVITKKDLVDPDILELVRMEAEEFVAGSFLEGAAIVGVSAKTGEGLDELKTAIAAAARKVKAKDASRHLRLPVDRVFTMKGFGTVVTGTLMAGTVKVEQELEAHPLHARLRVRGIQVHGAAAGEARAGQRTAINVAGDVEHLSRGIMLTAAGLFQPTRIIDTKFTLLPSAKPLKARAPVHFHAGTAEIVAEARPLEPGFVRFILREPLQLLPGDRFIVRMFSPVVTIGGGEVLDIAPPRRSSAERLRSLGVPLIVKESECGMGMAELIARTGMTQREIEAAAKDLVAVEQWRMDREWFEGKVLRLRTTLKEFHKKNPLLGGMTREEFRGKEIAAAPAAVLDALIASARDIVAGGELLRLRSHTLHLKQDEEAAIGKIESAFQTAGLSVPSTNEVLASCGVDPARAKSLLQLLYRGGKLKKISDDLTYHATAIEQLRALLASHKGESFGVPDFKEWTGISRKYAIPLLEFLDREKVTRREGDSRQIF